MSLVRSVGTIGGLTALSRVFGFARDMLVARALGAGAAADAWQIAFILPNTFRRLFAEGAFSVAFVPMYARALGTDPADPRAGEDAAERFANDTLSVFVWVLLGFSALAMLAMPVLIGLLAGEYRDVPGKFALSVTLARITFPYLMLVSLVAMLSGVLNARSRFAPGAFVPVLLNIVLIAAIGVGFLLRDGTGRADDALMAHALAIGLTVAGVAQLAYMVWATRRAGVRLRIHAPRLTAQVRRLSLLILPATFGAGIYQVSQFVDTFFATGLPQGSLTLLKFADRLNQLPLGIIGIALGTAILPMLARHIQAGDDAATQGVQAQAVEIALLLTLPGAAALAVCAPALTDAFFLQGQMTPADTATMASITVALVCGLPAYVLIKVFQPAFFSREDTRTPVWIAAAALAINIAINFAVVPRYGIVGLAGATAFTATLNAATLYVLLARRGWFVWTARLAGKVARQFAATALMAGMLALLMPPLAPWFSAGIGARITGLVLLVGAGLVTFFAAAFGLGALDKRTIGQLMRRQPAKPIDLAE